MAADRARPRWLLPLGVAAFVLVSFGAMTWLASDPGRRAVMEDLLRSPAGLLVLFALAVLSSATLILPAPGLALTALAATTGDPLVVGVVAGLGQAIGELTGYAAGASGRSLVPDNATARRVSDLIARRGAVVIFGLAVVPNPVFDVAGIAAGAVRMPVSIYFAAAAAGKVIKNVVIAGGAAGIGTLLGLASLG